MRINLVELQAKHLPRMVALDLLKVEPDLTEQEQADTDALLAKFDDYFKIFVPPNEKRECIGCGRSLGGMLGTFTWGLVHGEGFCSNCHYPIRAYHHSLKELSGFLPLQYHPDELTAKREELCED